MYDALRATVADYDQFGSTEANLVAELVTTICDNAMVDGENEIDTARIALSSLVELASWAAHAAHAVAGEASAEYPTSLAAFEAVERHGELDVGTDLGDRRRIVTIRHVDTRPTPPGPRVTATFQPQAWVNDHALDCEGRYTFDITDQIVAIGREAAEQLEDCSDDGDLLWWDNPARLLQPWNGPFQVILEDAIRDYYAALDRGDTT